MPVPETSIYKNNGPEFFKYNIGLSRQALLVQSESKACLMQFRTDNNFRLCIYSFYAAHIPTAFCFTKRICHELSDILSFAACVYFRTVHSTFKNKLSILSDSLKFNG